MCLGVNQLPKPAQAPFPGILLLQISHALNIQFFGIAKFGRISGVIGILLDITTDRGRNHRV
jgi:hypothetical protein